MSPTGREDPLSGVVYAAIVVMWAVVLVPMWLRRHDATSEARSVDRFSAAMRILSRRHRPAPDKRYVVMPRRLPESVTWHVSGASDPERGAPRPRAARRPRPSAASASAAARPAPSRGRARLVARRRRMLLGLVAVVLLSAVLAVAGVLPWPVQLVADLALVGFFVHLRKQARRAAVVAQRRRRAQAATTRRASGAPRPARTARPPVEAPAASYAEAAPYQGASYDASPGEAASYESGADEEATGTDDGWSPVPVPPPTYRMSAPAPEQELVERANPSVWSGGLLEEDDDELTADPGLDTDHDLDRIVERRRAVGD